MLIENGPWQVVVTIGNYLPSSSNFFIQVSTTTPSHLATSLHVKRCQTTVLELKPP